MHENHWYYIQDGKQHGPVSHQKILEMLEGNSLNDESYLWKQTMDDWKKTKDIDIFFQNNEETNEKLLPISIEEEKLSVKKESLNTQPRPWVRYWARQIDLFFASIVMCFLFPQMTLQNVAYFSLAMLFFWIFIEAILLATYGTTPGKWLLKISLKKKDGSKFSFSESLKRSFSVWVKGMGCGFQIIQIFTLLYSYYTLSKYEVTVWDNSLACTVSHETIGSRRIFFTICLMTVLFVALLTIAIAMLPSENLTVTDLSSLI
jgi:uncharacterized RDD family membrane protein YckC